MTKNNTFKNKARTLMDEEGISYVQAAERIRKRKLVPMEAYPLDVQTVFNNSNLTQTAGLFLIVGDAESTNRFFYSLSNERFPNTCNVFVLNESDNHIATALNMKKGDR